MPEIKKITTPLLSFDNVTLRFPEKILWENLSFQIYPNEHWAVVGPSGSGKTTLLHAIAGKHHVINGEINYHFFDDFVAHHKIDDPLYSFRRQVAMVSFHHDFRTRANTSDFFYQQRYQSAYADEAVSVQEYLANVAAEEQAYHLPEKFTMEWVIEQLHLQPLLNRSLIKLSSGETRRLLIGAALLRQPRLLLLDNPFAGLDADTRKFFHQLIHDISHRNISFIMVTTPEEIPNNFTHVLALGEKEEYHVGSREEFIKWQPEKGEKPQPIIDRRLIDKLGQHNVQCYKFQTAVRLENVSVQYDHRTILKNINWEIKKGEKWALLGPNGAGKTTLLSLLNGDNPQAYANDISLFDHKRGSGESIWDIKQKIGFMSSEMHQYLHSNQTCLSVVISGFFDILGVERKATEWQRKVSIGWMQALGIADLQESLFKHISAGKQRLLLLARALVKNPPLLILDEPCQGLDHQQRNQFLSVIEELCHTDEKTLIYVSHYDKEIPTCVTKVLKLEEGKIV